LNVEPTESRIVANRLGHHVITWDGGSRDTVVLCHGLLDMAWSWDPVARRLAARGWRAVAFDWRGHGESDWIGGGGYYHFPDYVLDLDELVPQIASGPTHLVGHSMGGTACSMYAGLRSDVLSSLTLVEGLGPQGHPVASAPDKYQAWLRTVHKTRRRSPKALRSVQHALERMRIANPDLPDELGLFLASKATRPSEDGEGLHWRFDPLHRTTSPMPFRPDLFAHFTSRIDVPTLAVFGEHGYRVEDESQRLQALPRVQKQEVPAVGHMVHWFAPETLATAIAEHATAAQ
jgi:pimeloyl-ACP methyl ester carboxylesterase